MPLTAIHPRDDQFVIDEPLRWGRAAWLLAGSAGWALLWRAFGPSTLAGFSLWGVGLVGLPVVGVSLLRLLQRRRRMLVRVPGRLLLDGEAIDMARVELRVEYRRFTKTPRGYSLSLWLMTSSGAEDLALGRFATLVEASSAAGVLEEFVLKANLRLPGATKAH